MIDQDDISALNDLYYSLRRHAIKNNAINVMSYLAKCGVDFVHIGSYEVKGDGKTSMETLNFLLAHGWDINHREKVGLTGRYEIPFMWHCVEDYDMVAWCLEHGAALKPRRQEPLSKSVITIAQLECPQILEVVARSGSVATFELLRAKGAPLGWRVLHGAVETATYGPTSKSLESEKDSAAAQKSRASHEERMAMVRHLLDIVKIDVNAPDQPAGSNIPGDYNGTPICYVAGTPMLDTDTRELTWLLLDRGADPTPALEIARQNQYPRFAEDVKAWQEQNKTTQKCCVQ
ncbi:hypothetical protein DM02DRAFT_527931 [Periconia macrospinosa]|uniref:Ankyrin n=1 Tax=Periconia macrospinosa TaxID=97972 RepID=A0A2V1DPP1_9PLEO|nr:hypothetical protein DM02DRAFT_527931 [Periconia macrospinosa]